MLAGPPTARAAGLSIDVTSMGAVGDGSTDDTAAFHSAISALTAAGGGTLVVPSGTYDIAPSSLTFPSNVTVAGTDATLRANAVGFSLVDVSGSNIVVSGVTFDGADLAVQGINIDPGSSSVTVRDSTVEHLRPPADQSAYPSLYGQMPVGIFVRGDGHDIMLDTLQIDDIVASHNNLASPPDRVARGILIAPANAAHITTGVTIQNSSFDGVGPLDDGDCVVIQDSNEQAGLQVLNNTFTGCAKRAVKIEVPGATISGNTVTNPFLGNNPCYTCSGPAVPYDMFAGISVYKSNVTVQNNTIGGVGSYYNGIDIESITTDAQGNLVPLSGVVVTGNNVSMGSQSNISAPSSLIRDFGPDDGVTISGNTLNHAEIGIYLSGPVTNPNILNNTMTDVVYATEGVPGSNPPPNGTPTPELGSGDLFAIGLVPLIGALLYRRRRARRARSS